jgi:hypothetical protein
VVPANRRREYAPKVVSGNVGVAHGQAVNDLLPYGDYNVIWELTEEVRSSMRF